MFVGSKPASNSKSISNIIKHAFHANECNQHHKTADKISENIKYNKQVAQHPYWHINHEKPPKFLDWINSKRPERVHDVLWKFAAVLIGWKTHNFLTLVKNDK